MICACQPVGWHTRESIALNGNPVIVDLDFNALGFLPVLIDQIAQHHDGHAENHADGVELVTAHRFYATPKESI